MRKIAIAVVLFLAACGDAKKSFDASFKTSFEKSFAESCTAGAMKDGAPADKKPLVVEFCGCIAKRLVVKHSVTELASMGGGGNQELIQAAIEDCKPR
jgi:hypothetical protein